MDKRQNDSQPPVIYMTPQVLPSEEEEIDLLELVKTVWTWKWFIGGLSFACTLLAVFVTLFIMQVMFTSNAVIQITGGAKSSVLNSMVSQYLGMGNSRDGNKTQTIVNYLNSSSLKKWIIKEYSLLQRWYPDIWDAEKKQWIVDKPEAVPTIVKAIQRETLKKAYLVSIDDQNSLITISYIDEDPKFAKTVTLGIIKELERYLAEDDLTDAKRNRIFVEKQLAKAFKELEYWERQIPDKSKTYSVIKRELETTTEIYTELRKQYELAKIEEDKEVVAFKVLDKPYVPELKSSPRRGMVCIMTMFVGACFGLFLCFIFEIITKMKTGKVTT